MNTHRLARPALLLMFTLGVFFGGGLAARGDEVLDQFYVPDNPNLAAGANSGVDSAQTFTVGIAGTLTRVEIWVYALDGTADGNLFFDVRPTVDGVPGDSDDDVLATVTMPVNTLPLYPGDFISLDISSAGVQVAEGDVLALVLRSDLPQSTIAYWRGTASQDFDPYPGGEWFTRQPGSAWVSGIFGMADLAFRTYVEPE